MSDFRCTQNLEVDVDLERKDIFELDRRSPYFISFPSLHDILMKESGKETLDAIWGVEELPAGAEVEYPINTNAINAALEHGVMEIYQADTNNPEIVSDNLVKPIVRQDIVGGPVSQDECTCVSLLNGHMPDCPYIRSKKLD